MPYFHFFSLVVFYDDLKATVEDWKDKKEAFTEVINAVFNVSDTHRVSRLTIKYISTVTLWLTFRKNAYLASLSKASLEIKRILWPCWADFVNCSSGSESVSTSCKTFEVNRNAKLAKIFVRFIDVVIPTSVVQSFDLVERDLTRAILFFVRKTQLWMFKKSFCLVYKRKITFEILLKKILPYVLELL